MNIYSTTTLLFFLLLLTCCNRTQTDTFDLEQKVDGLAWDIAGNSSTNPSINFIGTTDKQPLNIIGDTTILFRVNTGRGIWGQFRLTSVFRKGSWVSGLEILNCDTTLGMYSMVAVAKEHVKCILKDESGNTSYSDIGSKHFNVGNFDTQGEQYLFLDWGRGKWSIGNTSNFSSTIAGDTVSKTVAAYAKGGFAIKTAKKDSLLFYHTKDTTLVKSNLPLKIDGNMYANNIYSGVYTPQLSNLKNITACKAYTSQYIRVGNVITVSGKIDIDATTASTTQLNLKLPLTSAVSKDYEITGTGQSVVGECFSISADIINNAAQIKFLARDLSSNSYYYTYTYSIH
jgi:hypothetical protein